MSLNLFLLTAKIHRKFILLKTLSLFLKFPSMYTTEYDLICSPTSYSYFPDTRPNVHSPISCLFHLFLWILDNSSPVSTAQMSMDVGHPREHGKPTTGHILNKDSSPRPQKLSTASRSSVWGWGLMIIYPICARMLSSLILCRSDVANHSCCEIVMSQLCSVLRTAFQSILPILCLSVHHVL